MDIIKKIEQENMKAEKPEFNVGDTVKVHVRVIEGKRERIQLFEGVVLKKTARRRQRNLYRKKDFFRRRRRKNLPVTHQKLKKLKLPDVVRSEEQNSTTCATELVKQQKSKKDGKNERGPVGPLFCM